MEGGETVDSDELVEFFERRSIAVFAPEIVARGEGMLGVEADAQPPALLRRVDDVSNLLESVAETASLPGGDLERDIDFETGARGMDLIERAGDCLDAFELARAHMRA